MTRRRIVFKSSDGIYHVSPEFNGDKDEFLKIHSMDSCSLNWNDLIVKWFAGICSRMQFRYNCCEAQKEYHSFLEKEGVKKELLPVTTVQSLDEIPDCDELYILDQTQIKNLHMKYSDKYLDRELSWSDFSEINFWKYVKVIKGEVK